MHWILTPEAQISLRFALRSLVFQISKVFDFYIGYNGEFDIFETKIVKNQKLKISKIQNAVLWGPLGGNSGKVWKLLAAICRSGILKFLLQVGPMLTKWINSLKFQFLKFQKSQTVLWGPLGKISEVWKLAQLRFLGGVAFWNFCSHSVPRKWKIFVKNLKKIFFFKNGKKTYGHMAQGKQQLKFESNRCNNFRHDQCHRRMDES